MLIAGLTLFSTLVTGETPGKGFTLLKALLKLAGFHWWSKPGLFSGLNHVFVFSMQALTYFIVSAGFLWNNRKVIETSVDLSDYIKNILLATTCLSAGLKHLFILFNKKRVLILVKGLEDMGLLGEKYNDVSMKALQASGIYINCLFFNALLWITYSTFFKNGELPLLAVYPWDIKNSTKGYIAAWAIQFGVSSYAALGHTTLDVLLPLTAGVICGHLKKAGDKIKALGSAPPSEARDWILLKNFINGHNQLLLYYRILQQTVSTLFMYQVFYIIGHGCIIIFLIVKVNDMGLILLNAIPILAAAYIQLFLYCHFGENISNAFEEVTSMVLDNQWYYCTLRVKKQLRILLEFSKKPVYVMGGGGIYKASHQTYLNSLQESVSYFLFMKTMLSQ